MLVETNINSNRDAGNSDNFGTECLRSSHYALNDSKRDYHGKSVRTNY